jgi:putative FmdB family regulatory protein
MPIYEFYCRNCHTIYSFLSRKVDTTTIPNCPKVPRHKLSRQMSRFAISKGRGESEPTDSPEMNFDEERMEQAMMQMASELEGTDEEDPRAMAQMMRRLMQTTGMTGEDPDRIEEELGDVLEGEDPFSTGESKLQGIVRRMREAPEEDPEIYDM